MHQRLGCENYETDYNSLIDTAFRAFVFLQKPFLF
jgi:hypothetical protein